MLSVSDCFRHALLWRGNAGRAFVCSLDLFLYDFLLGWPINWLCFGKRILLVRMGQSQKTFDGCSAVDSVASQADMRYNKFQKTNALSLHFVEI